MYEWVIEHPHYRHWLDGGQFEEIYDWLPIYWAMVYGTIERDRGYEGKRCPCCAAEIPDDHELCFTCLTTNTFGIPGRWPLGGSLGRVWKEARKVMEERK